ncbi:HTH domain-containing protein, partial [Streptococcus pneumoniae]|nr:HTH domain-containing protein [Streptococcus pneumoniae]
MSRKQEQMETLLLLLRDSKDYISAKVLGEKLNCSDKTVYRLVKGINKDCPVEAFILSEKGRGFKLNPRSSLVDVDGNFTEAFDPEVRREKLLERLLLTAPKPHSIYDLGEEFYVSESVVLKDRQILQESLAIYGLDLKMRQRKLFIDGDEAQIRSAILNLLPMFNQLDLEQITQNKVQPLDGELAHFCLGLLITLERELGVNIPYPLEAFILSEKGRGFKLNPRSSLVDVDGNFTEAFDPEVRREKLLERLLLTAPKPHSIYDLGEEFYVSESVVLKDRQILQESLAIYGLDLKMRQRKLFIDGDEAQIRSAILNLLPMFNQLDLEQITQNKVQPLDGELAHFCLGLLITLERELGVNIPYP